MPTKAGSHTERRAAPGRQRTYLLRTARHWLLLTLLLLAILTVSQVYHRQVHYQLHLFVTPAGWGYTVLEDGQPRIYQPNIPGRAGQSGFANQQQARKVGERVIQKLKQGQPWPSLTATELHQLGLPD